MTEAKLGIWKHGSIKAFLTRGALRSVFQPLLFNKEEQFHIEFISIFNKAALLLDTSVMSGRTLSQWLVLTPLRFFEINFLSDRSGSSLVPLLKGADKGKAQQCAHYTQAFALWYLEQFLDNSESFKTEIGCDIRLVEDATIKIYGIKNLTLDYLSYFREKFDLETSKIDPRDWPLVYYYDLCDMLYSSEEQLQEVIGEWNDDTVQRMEYSTFAMNYFVECRKTTLGIS